MSFLGYIGKSLGAGTAPIVNANAASQSDIQYREFRDNAPNREELIRISMEEARRAEQLAKDREAERQRGQAYLRERRAAGLPTPDMGVTPNISATAPTTLKPAPAGLPAATTAAPAVTEEVAPPKPDKAVSKPDFYGSLAGTKPKGVPLSPTLSLEEIFSQNRTPEELQTVLSAKEKNLADARKALGATKPGLYIRTPAVRKKLSAEMAELEKEIAFIKRSISTVAPAVTPAAAPPADLTPEEAIAFAEKTEANFRSFVGLPPRPYTGRAPVTTPVAPVDLKPETPAGITAPAAAPAVAAPAAAAPAVAPSGYEQFRPAVEAVAPQLGFDLDEANTLMAGLGYGESRFNAGAKSPSGTFTGAYQLGPAIVSQYGARVQQRFGYSPTSPEGQAAITLMLAADNKKTLAAKGIETTPSNLALAHNQGAAGAAALLQNPSMPVAEALDKFAPEKNSGSKRASGQAWMKGQDVTKTTAGEFVERASAYYGKYSPEFSNVKSSPINPDVYRGDPNGLTFDMQQAEFMFNLAKQRQEDILNLIDASDPFSDASQQQLADAYTISERLVQQSGVYTQLQITKGLTSAYGGDTSYLNGVLSGVMDYPIEVTAEAGEQGIAYRVTAGGQPVSDSLSYDQMKQFTMRIADSQYDAELTALEVAAATKENEIALELNASIQKILVQGSVDFALDENKGQAALVLAALNAEFEKQGQGRKLVKLGTNPQGEDVVTDNTGQAYVVTTRQVQLDNGKKKDVTTLEPIKED